MVLTPKAARVNRGLTQVEMAEKMQVSVGVVQRLEADILRARGDQIQKFADIAGVDPNDLLASATPSFTGGQR